MLLSDFSHHHIEMACTLLETCGRFLFRSPESHLRTSVLLVREKPVVFCAEGLSCTELNQFFFFLVLCCGLTLTGIATNIHCELQGLGTNK